jgi:hypothetical protein
MKRLMKRLRKKIKLTEIEILNPENTKKFSGEKQTSSYGILKNNSTHQHQRQASHKPDIIKLMWKSLKPQFSIFKLAAT